jgi:thioredoxin 1
MPVEAQYRDPAHVPTREEIDREAGRVLLEFGAPWCGHCRAFGRLVAELLERHPEVKHVKVEDGPGEPLGRSFQVRLWPNFVFLHDGRIIRQLARPSHAHLEEAFRELVGPPTG